MKSLSKAALSLYSTGHRSWSRALGRLEERSERGAEVIGWILLVIGVIAIAALVIVAASGYASRHTGELGN